jgi:4'-phosphopantetheinyl transferase
MAGLSLYTAMLDPGAGEVARLTALLDAEERQRATQFRFDRDRRRFIVRRARLREILGDGIGVDPVRLQFDAGSHGKPRLLGEACHFSTSHSHDRMLVAVGDEELGCDIEKIVPDFDWPPLAERFFTTAEQQALLSDAGGPQAFFRCWTRKEAFVKGLGLGLSYPLDTFDVSVGDTAELLSGGRGWSLTGGMIADDHVFAVALPDRSPRVSTDLPITHL